MTQQTLPDLVEPLDVGVEPDDGDVRDTVQEVTLTVRYVVDAGDDPPDAAEWTYRLRWAGWPIERVRVVSDSVVVRVR